MVDQPPIPPRRYQDELDEPRGAEPKGAAAVGAGPWDRGTAAGGAWTGPPPPPVRPTNGLAIASLVLGVLWLFWIGSLLAVVFGHIALRQIRKANGLVEGRGLAITGAALGWVGLAVLAALVIVGVAVSDDLGDAQVDSTGQVDVADTTLPPTTEPPEYTNPVLAEEVLGRDAPTPEPPPGDTPADALETSAVIEGQGEGAVAGDTVTVHYVGVLSDGTEFDQSWERGEPFTVTLGQGQVIWGWDEGLVGAKIGERRHLVIGSDNAYGPQGQGSIPPDAPLAFDVDVVDIRS